MRSRARLDFVSRRRSRRHASESAAVSTSRRSLGLRSSDRGDERPGRRVLRPATRDARHLGARRSSAMQFAPQPRHGHIALRVAGRRRAARARARGEGRRVRAARSSTPASATWRFFRDPDGNELMLHRRYAPMMTAQSRAARALRGAAAADTTEEAWRFTDLKGFDPDAFGRPSQTPGDVPAESMLELDVAGCGQRRARPGSRSSARPRASASSRSTTTTRACATLVGWDEKFAAHNAALWQHGLLVARAEGRRARAAALRAHRELGRRRLALLAPARRRRGGLALRADRGVRVRVARPRRLLERGRRALRRAGGEARVRVDPEPLARDVALRLAPRARRARRRARLGRRRLRLEEGQDRGSRTTSPARARPRA